MVDEEKNVRAASATETNGYKLSPEEEKRRKQRNLAIALSILAFVIIVFAVTILRLGGSVAERSF